jgi:hypothetical protein
MNRNLLKLKAHLLTYFLITSTVFYKPLPLKQQVPILLCYLSYVSIFSLAALQYSALSSGSSYAFSVTFDNFLSCPSVIGCNHIPNDMYLFLWISHIYFPQFLVSSNSGDTFTPASKPRAKMYRRCRRTARRILELGIRWRWIATFTLRPLNPH